MAKRIVLSGYYGFDNLGDEAVLQSIIRNLREVEPGVELIVLSANPQVTADRYGVEARDRWNMKEVFKALRWSDLLISGGGSLLQDVTSSKTIPYYLGVVGLARALGKKVAFYAQGVGPIEGKFGRRLTRLVANGIQLITVRDQKSYQLLKEIGVKKPRMEVTVDPVISLEPHQPVNDEFRKIIRLKERCQKEERPLIGIAPRPWQGLKGFQEALIESAKRLQEEREAEILFIPMHYDMDLPLCREMAEQIPGAQVLTDKYLPDQLLAAYQQLDFLVGIRLHALIFAAAVDLAHLGISYDPKVDGFLKRIDDQPVASIEELKTDNLYYEISKRLDNKSKEIERIREAVDKLKAKARKNAEIVLNLIQKSW